MMSQAHVDPSVLEPAYSPSTMTSSGIAPAPALVVAHDGSWFQAAGRRVTRLARRPALRQIVRALVEARRDRPNAALTAADLIEAGWPGLLAEQGTARLYFTIYVLREKGLRGILVSREDGYLFDADCAVAIESSPR
jgi:hypothetical protein